MAVSYEVVPVLTYGLVTLYGDNTFHGHAKEPFITASNGLSWSYLSLVE